MFSTTVIIIMIGFFKSAFSTIYTFFVRLYTLIFPSKEPRLSSLTPYPVDLEFGPVAAQGWFYNIGFSNRHNRSNLSLVSCSASHPSSVQSDPEVLDHHCFSSVSTGHSTPPTALPRMPLPPLQRFVFPAHPSYQSNTSIHSVSASPVSYITGRPRSSHSASSNNSASDALSQSSTYSSSRVQATPPSKKIHKKQSPIVWFKDISSIVSGSGSSSSLTSMQSAGSSASNPSIHRHRAVPLRAFRSMKHNSSLSYKRRTARSIKAARQFKAPGHSRPPSEDPVSIVRKVFVECGTEVDTEGGGARARLMNRETARSFGGMEIVAEEDEEDEPFYCRSRHAEKAQKKENSPSSPTSCYSLPESTAPSTPVSHCLPLTPDVATSSPQPKMQFDSDILMIPNSRSSQLPYLMDHSRLGMPLSSADSLCEEVQGCPTTTRFSRLCSKQRVSVVTWSDLVSFSSYGLDLMAEPRDEDEGEEQQQKDKIEHHQEKREYLADNSMDDSGVDLAAVLDSMSILVGQGLDPKLLLSPPRQSGHLVES